MTLMPLLSVSCVEHMSKNVQKLIENIIRINGVIKTEVQRLNGQKNKFKK